MRTLRRIHQYLGMVFAPAILFFAFSGALQTFSLHENHGGGPYKPPGWIVAIAALHKDQALPRAKADHEDHGDHDHGGAPPPKAAKPPKPPGPSPLPLKIFVLSLAVGLMLSTLLGVYIGLKNRTARTGSLIALALGVVLPVVLIFI